ncbi:hypothetical protein GPECTOR_6g735 [Gonium pectorale]|uniref:HhH-GPD domain-containing protein n=1 Tax=Gonium pectorale TaxID=33097 RepID=A0A150GVB0_GONPE|nr:hypothetical protein GPECTOR_6g735 [Gonium pectorale]|eukprot:KXZ53817.1 hypothetical protein GPECTOR_6g735 [Gonium pectorale]
MIVFGHDEKALWARRVGSFMRAMRGVLGDRSLRTRWGGSVLDSVVGTFLTQTEVPGDASGSSPLAAAGCPSSYGWHGGEPGEAGDVVEPSPFIPEGEDMVEWADVLAAPEEKLAELIRCSSAAGPSMSLEWLRNADDEEAQRYLLGIAGLGRKSVACISLLTLHRKEFPVDINVARVFARLGWIPIEVHKFLRARLMSFDRETLYELHYQAITLGKVFCQKRDPNCGGCPLAAQCDYAKQGGRRLQGDDGSQAPGCKAGGAAGPAASPAAASADSGDAMSWALRVLGLAPTAHGSRLADGAAAARQRFRELSMAVHPDKCGHPRAADAFNLLSRALAATRVATAAPVDASAEDETPLYSIEPDGTIRIPQHAKRPLSGSTDPEAHRNDSGLGGANSGQQWNTAAAARRGSGPGGALMRVPSQAAQAGPRPVESRTRRLVTGLEVRLIDANERRL